MPQQPVTSDIENAKDQDPLIGTTLGGRYQLLEYIAQDGMSSTYKARQTGTEALVALKLIHKTLIGDMKAVHRFRQEAKTLGNLSHPNIIGMKTIDADNGLCFLAMEYAEGISLSEKLKTTGPLKMERFTHIFGQTVSALSYAHGQGIVHQDLTPSNLMIATTANGGETVKLLNCGLAKLVGATDQIIITDSEICLGSLPYTSPEQLSGKPADNRSDIYSLGCIMFEALAATPPFNGSSSIEIAQKHLEDPVPEFGGKALRPVMQIIAKCMAKNPDHRYQSMNELAIAIREGISPSTINSTFADKKGNRSFARLVSLAIVAGTLLIGLFIFQKNQDREIEADRTAINADLLPPGVILNQFCLSLNSGETPSEASAVHIRKIAEDRTDERLRKLAYRALAVYDDARGNRAQRDLDFKEVIKLSHEWNEAASQTATEWAACLKRDGDRQGAVRVLKEELGYAKNISSDGDAVDLEESLQRLDAVDYSKPELH